MELIVFAVTATIVIVASAVVAVRWWTWRPVVKRRVMVQTDDGVSFTGVVLSRRGPLLVLEDVTVLAHDQGKTLSSPADGTVVVDRSRVRWIQVA